MKPSGGLRLSSPTGTDRSGRIGGISSIAGSSVLAGGVGRTGRVTPSLSNYNNISRGSRVKVSMVRGLPSTGDSAMQQ